MEEMEFMAFNGCNDEEDGFDYEIAEGFASNMPCDNTGYCDPMHCPQFHECQGHMH